jgi:Phage integrase, N-terminal SAM-like domain
VYAGQHEKRRPIQLGAHEVQGFLEHLARDRRVSAGTQNQALATQLWFGRPQQRPSELWPVSNLQRPSREIP